MFLVGAVVLPGTAAAKPAMQEQVHALDQKIRMLERKLEIEKGEEADASEKGTTLSAGDSGFIIESSDGAFEFKLRALVQGDARIYTGDENAVNDTFLIRRARPIFEGKVGDFVSFRLMPDFGGTEITLFDAYVDLITPLHYTNSAGESVSLAVIRGGKFKSPVGLERLQ
jgi:phosphate-selective porin OprO/OprP